MMGSAARIAFFAIVTVLIVACADSDDDREHFGEPQQTATPTSIADRENPDVPAPVRQPHDDTETETVQHANIPEYRIEGGNREIYVTDLTGERQQRLTDSPAMNATPAWSPDGEQIAWVQMDDAGDRETGLYVANADGSNPRLVTSPASGRGIDWHPDGDRIALVSAHETDSGWDEVHVVNLDGSDRQQVTFWEEIPTDRQYYGSTYPAWSPDGDRLAVVVDQIDEFEQIYILDTESEEPARQLTDIPDQRKGSPTWSPDGAQVALHATPHESPYPQIFLVDVETGQADTLVAEDGVAFLEPDWSPDGHYLALVAVEDLGPQIHVMDVDSRERHPVTEDPSGNNTPRWSPDGSRLLFIAERDGQLARPCSEHVSITFAPPPDLEELVWSSHHVVVGTIVEEHGPDWAEPLNVPMDTCLDIYTDYTLEVETQLRGEPVETVRVRVPGGRIGEYEQVYEPTVEIEVGERMLLFLTPDLKRELLPDAFITSPQRAWTIVDEHLGSGHLPGELDGKELSQVEQQVRDALTGGPPVPEPHGFVPLEESPDTE